MDQEISNISLEASKHIPVYNATTILVRVFEVLIYSDA